MNPIPTTNQNHPSNSSASEGSSEATQACNWCPHSPELFSNLDAGNNQSCFVCGIGPLRLLFERSMSLSRGSDANDIGISPSSGCETGRRLPAL
ncbi:hypothetical protein SLEP1_g55322 [Rubroshorea leprosula]|uniref:Uncharacterized protein n=1 Tax=Rubroshorea leprosula TaxID=152421 RepID=A0AAV5MFX5_9ROSI|nr:hypothetical protein SLEP1_g55322 [Rubroshorea leprosula]